MLQLHRDTDLVWLAMHTLLATNTIRFKVVESSRLQHAKIREGGREGGGDGPR